MRNRHVDQASTSLQTPLVLKVTWALLQLDQRDQRDHWRMSACATDTSRQSLTPVSIARCPPGHLVARTWWFIDPYSTLLLLLPLPSSPACSAESSDRGAWRNPLSRHFSFPLTDGPRRAGAFGPPAWLAARQLNKLSSCYNSLKHFQLPQSNKCCRRAVGRFSTRSRKPSGCFLFVCLDLQHATKTLQKRAKMVLLLYRTSMPGKEANGREQYQWFWTFLPTSAPSPSFASPPVCVAKIPNRSR